MKAKSSEREARLAAALRENLKRRKARVRARREDALQEGEDRGDRRPNKAKKVQ